jgi:hypothetical protein
MDKISQLISQSGEFAFERDKLVVQMQVNKKKIISVRFFFFAIQQCWIRWNKNENTYTKIDVKDSE